MKRLVLVLCAMLIGGFANESAALDAAAAPENQPATTADPAQRVRTAAFVIAAADSPDHLKSQADFVCPGTDDHAVINAAIAALPEPGGRVHLSAGNYSIGAVEGTYGGINILRSNVLLTGEGSGTRLMLQGGLADINVIWIKGYICDVTVRDLYINGNGKEQIRNRDKGWQGCNGIKAIEPERRLRGPYPHNIRVENCHIENCRLMAVMLHGDNVEVANCYFTGDFGSHVIELLGASGRIEGCTMRVRKGEVAGFGWATDDCHYYHIVNNKIFVEEGGTISSHIFNNWPPLYNSKDDTSTNLYQGIISGNIFVNEGKAGSVRLQGYLDLANNNIFRGVPVEIGTQKQKGGGMWGIFEHNMLINSSLTVDIPFTSPEYFTLISGNGLINSPVIYKSGNVIWGNNPGMAPNATNTPVKPNAE